MRYSTNAKYTETLDGTQVFRGTAVADLAGERCFAMHPGVAVSAVTDGTEAVAVGMGSRAIARGLGARAIADGQDATASAYGLGAIAIAINGGTAYAHEGATVHEHQA
jgi:hypothetical protein